MQPRRKQPSLTIRSERAIERLKLLTRDGRSQAAVIEEALERMPLPQDGSLYEDRKAELEAIVERLSKRRPPIPSMEEFDRREYDQRGLPR